MKISNNKYIPPFLPGNGVYDYYSSLSADKIEVKGQLFASNIVLKVKKTKPTISTKGIIGELFIVNTGNSLDDGLYYLEGIVSGDYIWRQIPYNS